jgi:hypothetical protein
MCNKRVLTYIRLYLKPNIGSGAAGYWLLKNYLHDYSKMEEQRRLLKEQLKKL